MSEGVIDINPNFNFQQQIAMDKEYTCTFFGHFKLILVYTSTDSQQFQDQVGRSILSPITSVRFFAEDKTTYFSFCCQNKCLLIRVTQNEPINSLIKDMSNQSVIYITSEDYQYINQQVPEIKKIPDNQFNDICREYMTIDQLYFNPLSLQITGNDMTFSKFLFISHSLISTFYVRRNYFHVSLFSFSFPVDCPSRSFQQFSENNFFFLRPMNSQVANLCFERRTGYLCVRKFYPNRALYEKEKGLITMLGWHPNIINCFGFIDDDQTKAPSLLYEFASNSSLDDFLESGVKINDTIKSRMLYQILGALDYLHMNGIIHQQLVPENILITSNYDAYLSHFCTARIYYGEDKFDSPQGFLFYDDLALYGVLIYEIANMKLLWDRKEYPNTTADQRLVFVHRNQMQCLPIELGSIVSLYEQLVRNELSNRLSSFIYLSQFCLYYYYFYDAELCNLFQQEDYNRQINQLPKMPLRKDIQYAQYQSSKDDAESRFRLALFYREGFYLRKEIRASNLQIEKAANLSLPDGNYEFIKEQLSIGNKRLEKFCLNTIEYYSTLDDYQYYKWKFFYSKIILDNPRSPPEEVNKASNLLIQAVQFNADAKVYLSDLMFEGKLFKKDDTNAVAYLKEAAKQASATAVYKLAVIYENGIQGVVEKNDQTALKYYFIASSLRNEDALKVLVGKYIHLNEKDKIYAYRLLENAAKQRIITGLKFIGIMYKDWAESKDNPNSEEDKKRMLEKALSYLTIAAENGDLDCLIEMANRYYYSKGVVQDLTLAFKYYKKYKELGGQASIKEFDNQPTNG